MEFYKRVSREEMKKGVKVEYVGVYALRWPQQWPTDGFVEVEDRELIRYLLDKEVIVCLSQDKRKFKEVKAND